MRKIAAATLLTLATILTLHSCKKSDNDNGSQAPVDIKDSVIATGLNHPWELIYGPDDHLWFTERGGRISRLNVATGERTTVITIADVDDRGEGGLLGMAIHPQFATSPQVFVVYNYTAGGNYLEKVVRYEYNGTTLINPVNIQANIPAANIHNGSRLLIADNKLWVTTGDADNPALAQNASSLAGKVLRYNIDGSIPADNPVAGNPYWSMGHRNPQGLVFARGKLFSSEHGPSNDDEVNIIEKSRNYGWPNVQGFCNTSGEQTFCAANNVREPLEAWTPTIAVCGLDYYDKDLFPQFRNSLLMTTLKAGTFYQLKMNGANDAIDSVKTFYAGKYSRLRDLAISPSGKIYICTGNGNNNDRIIELSANQ